MVDAVPIGYEDGEALHKKQVMENKERLVRKTFLVVMLAVAVICGIRWQQVSLDKPEESSRSGHTTSLFGDQRLLKGLLGLCGKKDEPTPPPPPPAEVFTPFTYGQTVTGISVAAGQILRYQATLPSDTSPAAEASYTAGVVDVYFSFSNTKPANGVNTGLECHNAGGATKARCTLTALFLDVPIYVWVVGTGGDTTISLRIW